MNKQKSKTKEFDFRQIDSFEKALEFKGESLEQFQERTKGMDVDTVGYEKCKAIVFALNGGKHVKQGYYPWFYNPNRSSASFSYFVYHFGSAGAVVGARLLLVDRPTAIYAGETFPKEYSQFINATEE
ncbi:hypothetical protein CHU00_17510 [Sphingobacterium cellulitidis]|uniref:hypothetical protein n=1 Tax=Sphingobacterium cellulitidis TaxID=1768011 RepID=UPI000B93EA90|nr:hypothetical protein [Sphingobacterium cellulitidis]OYD44306.1 hypothetical protein CHU00_17510 [Sphingobacterium cellulitidis]